MKKLMVSYDCGITYRLFAEAEDAQKLADRAGKEDLEGLRWYIENEDGTMDHQHISPIHKEIIGFMLGVREKEKRMREEKKKK